ncbi:ABC transporter substrate-binding protein [Methanococcoides methylutens]|uniref:ABC-type nitrate/sulfonate/bicarbonate transport systems, periplasmic component n=1 Tax=Methanococcoides methylutens MM1 TaxID=1434104 RepID=A0A0E3X0Y7_METMT|nr:ABC transporter substrate-binding protein [Methanococcoides methylutens]AKB84734.1 ABC-type nitrate/sulfonate/bicarbonate transport systems, periplasmic component [Methanococcoides methylutens MM1]
MMKLRIGHLSTMYHTSFILMGTDWLEKAGIEPEWKLFGGGPAIVHALENNELDIGYIGLPPTMIGIDRGLEVKCIAGGHVEGTVMITTPEFRTLEECRSDRILFLEQFKGHLIACPPSGSIHDVIIRNYNKEAGFENDIDVLNYEWADMIPEAIADGEIKVAVGTPSLAVVAKRYCDAKMVIPPEKLWPDNPSYGIVATCDMIENSPDTLLKFIKLHENACEFIRENTEEASKLVSDTIEIIDADFVKEMYEVSPKYSAGISEDYIGSTMRFVDVLNELGYISKKLEQKDIFDLHFVEELEL